MKWLSKLFSSGKICVCVKDRNYNVLHQNKHCLALCGDRSSNGCKTNCMLLYRRQREARDREEGTQYYPHQVIEGQYYDIVFINDGECLTTILYPLRHKHQADLKYFSKWGLTGRETEIVSVIIKGHSNDQIARTLFISRGTLKNHLSNIYRKLPEHVIAPWRQTNKA